jgi:prefoldin subunit 5
MADNKQVQQELANTLKQLQALMDGRKARIEELRAEISELEALNEALQETVSDWLKSF